MQPKSDTSLVFLHVCVALSWTVLPAEREIIYSRWLFWQRSSCSDSSFDDLIPGRCWQCNKAHVSLTHPRQLDLHTLRRQPDVLHLSQETTTAWRITCIPACVRPPHPTIWTVRLVAPRGTNDLTLAAPAAHKCKQWVQVFCTSLFTISQFHFGEDPC